MYGLPGSHRPVSGTSPRVPHTLTTVHLVTPPLLQNPLPPAGVQLRHRSRCETVPGGRAIVDSAEQNARCCVSPLQSDVPPLWPDLHSLPTARLRSHTSGRLTQIEWSGLWPLRL